MADEMSKSELLSELLYEEFDSRVLLDAVSHLDTMRRHLADRLPYQPPQIRKDLMDLHEMVMDVSNGSSKHNLDDIYEALDEVETPVFKIMEAAENLLAVLSKLNDALNVVANEIEDEE